MPSYSESYSKTFSSVNGNVIDDREIRKINDNNIKLHILERDKDLIMESEIPLSQRDHLFESQKDIVKSLILQTAMRNFQKIRDSISLQKERNKKHKKKTPKKKNKTPKKKKKTPKKKKKATKKKKKAPKKKKKKLPTKKKKNPPKKKKKKDTKKARSLRKKKRN